ncbi:transposase [uncultured Methanobacterium sp.]|uniref:transposase n=1 Tax=uncultured Methanobacterium sp. TaxID=176306 RepID=UPI002AA7A35B|nr:transposase [uncultured Methanobacterium sp.]
MKMPLVHDIKNPKCKLLDIIFIDIDCRETQLELSRNGMKPMNKVLDAIKIRLIAMFYGIDIKYVVNELNNSEKLRKAFRFRSTLNYLELSEVFSRFNELQVLEFVLKRSNKEFKKNTRGNRKIIIDSTDIRFNINLDKKFYDDRILEENGYEIGFSSSKGKFIGGKLTIALDYDTCQPLTMLFHRGAVHDSKIYLEILADLKRRRILKKGDLILADKGYFSFKNYRIGLMDYKIVPLIRPKKNTRKDKVFSQFNYPLELFKAKNSLKKLCKQLVNKLSKLYDKWDDLKSIRSKIEDFNKFFKNGVGYEQIPSYTYKSAAKTTYLSVLLAALIVSKLKPDKKQLQQLAEM